MEIVKMGLPEVWQMSHRTDKEKSLTTSEFITEQANELYCKEAANALGKPGTVHSCNRNGVVIRKT